MNDVGTNPGYKTSGFISSLTVALTMLGLATQISTASIVIAVVQCVCISWAGVVTCWYQSSRNDFKKHQAETKADAQKD